MKDERVDDTEEQHVRPGSTILTNGQRCICGPDSPLLQGLGVITDDIIQAARRNKRKIQAEFVASTADVDNVKITLADAQDKVVLLRGKHQEMLRHQRCAEEHHKKASEISKSATIQLAEATSSGAQAIAVQNLQSLAKLSQAVLRSSTVELERITKKIGTFEDDLQRARYRVELQVEAYEDLLRRRDRASKAPEQEEVLINTVTEFMQKEGHPRN